jgi:GTP-binding protein LepA
LIDTPGHVDFNYEVSRSLAAVEGVILLVDASQGIQAQTVTNLRLALEQKLVIIPVLNKIDLSGVDLGARKNELAKLLDINKDEILLISAKTGQGVEKVLEKVIEKVPPPKGKEETPLRALIFDSIYSEHKGVVAYVRMVDGQVEAGDELEIIGTKTKVEAIEVGIFQPQLKKTEKLSVGSIGYIMTGLKNIQKCRVGDTITKLKIKNEEIVPLPGYKEVKPMVFSSLYNQQSREARKLGEALEKLKLNDASLSFEPEASVALGFGFRCGFLGLFHLEIIKERLKREYGFEVIATRPSVAYNVWVKSKNEKIEIHSPEQFPTGNIEKVEEPIMNVKIITPPKYLGNVLELIKKHHGQFIDQKYLVTDSNLSEYSSLIIEANIPLAMLIVDFYDKLKNVSAGYASMSYDFVGYKEADLLRLDILLAGERQEAFSSIVYQEDAIYEGRKAVEFLKENLPRQMFEVKIQAVTGWQPAWKGRESGGKIIASERLPAMRKDVTAKLYGGDVTRKNKLLKKQKKGKKKMMAMGKVDVPSDIYIKMLRK